MLGRAARRLGLGALARAARGGHADHRGAAGVCALAPFVGYLRRWLPRWLAILLVYVGLLAVLGLFGYLLITASVEQVRALIATARHLLTPGANDTPSPLIEQLHNFGISQQQLDDLTRSLATYAETLGKDLLPLLTGIANGVLDTVLILVVSVYLLMDGARVGAWLRTARHTAIAGG